MGGLLMAHAIALRLDPTALTRMAIAGGAWGLMLSAGFVATALWQCGVVCLDEVAFTTAACVGAGILTIGPLAAFRRPGAGRST
jgi:hypothetical protein